LCRAIVLLPKVSSKCVSSNRNSSSSPPLFTFSQSFAKTNFFSSCLFSSLETKAHSSKPEKYFLNKRKYFVFRQKYFLALLRQRKVILRSQPNFLTMYWIIILNEVLFYGLCLSLEKYWLLAIKRKNSLN
jgi:hypothetical protein